MKRSTIIEIKKQLSEFYLVVNKVSNHFNYAKYSMISVILQRAAHNAFGCINAPSTKEAEKELYEIKDVLKALADYYPQPHSYFEVWVYIEYSHILDGLAMSEDMDSQSDSLQNMLVDSEQIQDKRIELYHGVLGTCYLAVNVGLDLAFDPEQVYIAIPGKEELVLVNMSNLTGILTKHTLSVFGYILE